MGKTSFAIEVKNLQKRFGDIIVADGVDLMLEPGGNIAILGESGCGKTTLLRMLAGLESPDSGEVLLGGKNMASIPPHLRGIAMTMQTPALWPHMTVRQIILFGVTERDKKEREELLRGVAEAMEIKDLLGSIPARLSGGQAKRVALARALAARREILLLDEPLSNLDAELKKRLIPRLHEFTSERTLLLVTHDPAEAKALCGRVYYMKDGLLTADPSA